MSLEELLKDKIKSLYKTLNKIKRILNSNKSKLKENTDDLELISIFLEDLFNIENIRNIDTEIITDLLLKYKYLRDNTIEEDLKVIKILLKGIYDSNLKLELSLEQKKRLDYFIDCVKKLYSDLEAKNERLTEDFNSVKERNDDLESQILSLEAVLEKVSSKDSEELLDDDDLESIRMISDDKSVDIDKRKDFLIKFIEYNNDRQKGIPKKYSIDVNDVVECFNKYNLNLKNEIKKYLDEVLSRANIKNIKEILKYMDSIGILNEFDKADLLAICLHGTVDSVVSAYEDINSDEDSGFYYSTPSAWIDNIETKKFKKKKSYVAPPVEKSKKSLSQIAHFISRKEIKKNIEYLKKEGFVFDLNDIGAKKAIITDGYKLRETVNALKTYGVIDKNNISTFKVWILAESQVVEKLDRFIEMGLLEGYNAPYDYQNYLKKYLSRIHNMKYATYLLLYKLKQTMSLASYYSIISSKINGKLSNSLNDGRLLDTLGDYQSIAKFKKDNFVNYEDLIPNYSLYEEKINSNYDVDVDDDIFYNPEIRNLELNYRVDDNPYVYVFDGVVISRIKVLRNYAIIRDDTMSSLMAAIVSGSFLTEESFDKIARSINYFLGGNNGLSKKI